VSPPFRRERKFLFLTRFVSHPNRFSPGVFLTRFFSPDFVTHPQLPVEPENDSVEPENDSVEPENDLVETENDLVETENSLVEL